MKQIILIITLLSTFVLGIEVNNTSISVNMAKVALIEEQVSKEETLYKGVLDCIKTNGLPNMCDTETKLQSYIPSTALVDSTGVRIQFNPYFMISDEINSHELMPRMILKIKTPFEDKLDELNFDRYYGYTLRNENYVLTKAYNETWYDSEYGSKTNEEIFKKDEIFYGFDYETNRFAQQSIEYSKIENTVVSLKEPTNPDENDVWYQPNGDLTFTKRVCTKTEEETSCSFKVKSTTVTNQTTSTGTTTNKAFYEKLETAGDCTVELEGTEILVATSETKADTYACYNETWYATSSSASSLLNELPIALTHKAYVSSYGGGTCSQSSPCTIQEALDQDPQLRELHIVDSPADNPIEITGDLNIKKVTLLEVQEGSVFKVNGYLYMEGSYKNIDIKVQEGAEFYVYNNIRISVTSSGYINKLSITNKGKISNGRVDRGFIDGWHDSMAFKVKELVITNENTGEIRTPYYTVIAHSYDNNGNPEVSKATAKITNKGNWYTANGMVYLGESWNEVSLKNTGEITQTTSGYSRGYGRYDRNLINTGDAAARVLKTNILNEGKIYGKLGSYSESLFYLSGSTGYQDIISINFENKGEMISDGTILWGRYGVGTLDFNNSGTMKAANYQLGNYIENGRTSYWDDNRAFIVRWWHDYGHITHKLKVTNTGYMTTTGRPFLVSGEYRSDSSNTPTTFELDNQSTIRAGRGAFYFNYYWDHIDFTNGSENNKNAIIDSVSTNTTDSDIVGGGTFHFEGLNPSKIKNYGILKTYGDVFHMYGLNHHGSYEKHEITIDNYNLMQSRDEHIVYLYGYRMKNVTINNHKDAIMQSNQDNIRVWEGETASMTINNDGKIYAGGHTILANGYHRGDFTLNNSETGEIMTGPSYSTRGNYWNHESIHIRDYLKNNINNQGKIYTQNSQNLVRIYGGDLRELNIINGSPTNKTAYMKAPNASVVRLWESANVRDFYAQNYGEIYGVHHGFLISFNSRNITNTTYPKGTYEAANVWRGSAIVENYGNLHTYYYSPIHYTGYIEQMKVKNDINGVIRNERDYHVIYSGSDTQNVEIENQGIITSRYYRNGHGLININMKGDTWSGALQNKYKITNGSPTNKTAKILGSYAFYTHSGYVNHLEVKNYGEIRGGENNGGYRGLSFWDSLDVDHIDIYNGEGAKIEGQSEAIIINGNSYSGYSANRSGNNPNDSYLKVENHGTITGYRNEGIRYSYGQLRKADLINTGTIAMIGDSRYAATGIYLWYYTDIIDFTLKNTGTIYSRSHAILSEGYTDSYGTFTVENAGVIKSISRGDTTIRTNNYQHFNINNGETTINGVKTTNNNAEIRHYGSGIGIRLYSAGNHGNFNLINNGLIKSYYDPVRMWDGSGIGNVNIENNGIIQSDRERVIFINGRHASNYKFNLVNTGIIERTTSHNNDGVIYINEFSYIDIYNKGTSSKIQTPFNSSHYGRSILVTGEVRGSTSGNGYIKIRNEGLLKSPHENVYAWDGIDNFTLENEGTIENYRDGSIFVNGDHARGNFTLINGDGKSIKTINPNNNDGIIHTDQFAYISVENGVDSYIGAPYGDSSGSRALVFQGEVRDSANGGGSIYVRNKGKLESRNELIWAWDGIDNFKLDNYGEMISYHQGVEVNGDHARGDFILNNYDGALIERKNPNNHDGVVRTHEFENIVIYNGKDSKIKSPTGDSHGRGINIEGEIRGPSHGMGEIYIKNEGLIQSAIEGILAWGGVDNFKLDNYGEITVRADAAVQVNGDYRRGDFILNNFGPNSIIQQLDAYNDQGSIHTHEFKKLFIKNDGFIGSRLNDNYGRGIFMYGTVYDSDGNAAVTIVNNGTIQSKQEVFRFWENEVQNVTIENYGVMESSNDRVALVNLRSSQGLFKVVNAGLMKGRSSSYMIYTDGGRYHEFDHKIGNRYEGLYINSSDAIFRENVSNSWVSEYGISNYNTTRFKY